MCTAWTPRWRSSDGHTAAEPSASLAVHCTLCTGPFSLRCVCSSVFGSRKHSCVDCCGGKGRSLSSPMPASAFGALGRELQADSQAQSSAGSFPVAAACSWLSASGLDAGLLHLALSQQTWRRVLQLSCI